MYIFFSILLGIILGWGCSYYAKLRGLNPTTWFIAGFLFGFLALLALFLIPKRKEKAKTAVKLPSQKTPTQLTPISPLHAEKLWYFLDEQKAQFGPMSFNALNQAWQDGKVKEQTFVWNEVMENWQSFQEIFKQS